MTEVLVQPLFVGQQYQTQVWASQDVLDRIAEFLKGGGDAAAEYILKAQYYAEAGFHQHEGDKRGIRYKWDGVYAIEPWATLFRLYGFYEPPTKTAFIIPTTTLKKGQKMRKKDKAEVRYAAQVLDSGAWRKVDPE